MPASEEQRHVRIRVPLNAINELRGSLSTVASDPEAVRAATATDLVCEAIGFTTREVANVDRSQVAALGGSTRAEMAQFAEVASRCDMGDVGPEGRLTPCPVGECWLVGDMETLAATVDAGP